ncbi:NUDIX hydrolase [Crocosphaera sp. UHCC 0190]|uniref:NUDIX hydrolase n=1 Tax=Crocosphaera sp. UHCC 0190 TaxID=3110246 RepID=UPI002B1F2EF2|nr:NUDIX hydrolase [Crocosphaera sp. UHCC 0190]MEA5508277.1 NUDIX hydrolase [Crocosphaera sp. UHCC 0190]
MNNQPHWHVLERFIEINTPWLTLIGEKLQDERQQVLDYWRVEKADSVVIVTIQNAQFLLPTPSYRPGVKQATLDFPGGRVPSSSTPTAAVPEILYRELGILNSDIIDLTPLNQTGWAINSSFSNQKLYGFVAEISPHTVINGDRLTGTYPTTSEGVTQLLKALTCLQCRALLWEWFGHRLSKNRGVYLTTRKNPPPEPNF